VKKKLIIINGTMGVGKTETCSLLNKCLQNSVWLDGDWGWMINPFTVNDENIKMVEDNLKHLLRNFLTNSSIDYVLFNWVLHTEEGFDLVLSWVEDLEYDLIKITLTCSEEELKRRLVKDIEKNKREESIINKSVERLRMYDKLDTIKLDTSKLNIKDNVNEIIRIINNR
jgi:broad-specificity NMP kinase